MYKAFNLKLSLDSFTGWRHIGLNKKFRDETIVRSELKKFADDEGTLSADKIATEWFPAIKADVFISHSHADREVALGLAGWLQSTFDLNVFIDSNVWGYAGELQRIIDDEYCWNPGNATYSYEKRNKTTSHVNIILSTALGKMIDATECIIFLNTPNSVSCSGYITDEATESPWIFSEISMTRYMRSRLPRQRRILRKAEASNEEFVESVNIKYDLTLDHLTNIDNGLLDKWEKSNFLNGTSSLDALYDLTGQ